MSIVTDSKPVADPKDPEHCNVFALYSLFATEAERAAMAERYRAGGMGYAVAKEALLEKITAQFEPARQRAKERAQKPDYVEEVLQNAAKRARAEATQPIAKVWEPVGLKAKRVDQT